MKNPFAVRITAVIVVLLACEAVAWIGLGILDSHLARDWRFQEVDFEKILASKEDRIRAIVSGQNDGYIDMDAELGWTVRPGGTFDEEQANGRIELYRANSQGIRSSREYTEKPKDPIVRIAAFGDSFTHADDVANGDTWTTLMEQDNEGMEVLNFGVPGYGTDQALLRYRRDGSRFSPDIAILGVMSENLNRNLNVFVPFYRHESWPTTKPRFLVTNAEGLELRANPYPRLLDYQELLEQPSAALEQLGTHDWWYRAKFKAGPPDLSALFRTIHYGYIALRYTWLLDNQGLYNRNSEHYRLLLGIIDAFRVEARQNGAIPVILMFPSWEVLTSHRLRGEYMYSPLLEDLDARSIRYIDLLQGIRKHGNDLPGLEVIPGHFSAEGNRIIAKYVTEELAPLVRELHQ